MNEKLLRACFSVICGFLLPPVAVAQAQNIRFENKKSVEEKVDGYIQSLPDPFNGTILLAIGDKILINKGYGMADVGHGIPNTGKTKYQIASTTKHFTSVLIMQMAEKGLIDLNATIDAYLSDYPKDKAGKITIHHLLLHQSGIQHHITGIENYLDVQTRLFHTQNEYIKLFCDKNLVHEPGKGMTYTTPGYFLLGVILEKVSGQSYAELLVENIFQPLEMKNTFVGNNRTIHKDMATGYMKGLDGLVLANVEDMSNLLAAGDMVSTTEDLYRFQRAMNLNGDDILSQKYKELLFKPHARFGFIGLAYVGGLCPISGGNDGKKLTILGIGEGSNFGFRSRMTRFMELDACYVVLSNIQSDLAMTQAMYEYLEDILLDEIGTPAWWRKKRTIEPEKLMEVAVGEELLNKYKGFYKKDDKTFIGIVGDSKRLSRQLFENYYGFNRVLKDDLIPIDKNILAVNGQNGLEYRFVEETNTGKFSTDIVRNGKSEGKAVPIQSCADLDLADYHGDYYSVERQKTYQLSVENNSLIISDFPKPGKTTLTPLKKDLFGCDQGFLTFHRYGNGKIRDFKFNAHNVDDFAGFFIKK